ncbi:hypothetical protein R3P38DRAFT_2765870 [Favolaschia claudopus]|uniref:Uncharacterized protein n=1 Tax=Favolaschia claudopus TaxID=2862362 RepID=A0AAW0D7A6_9AGAR
MPSPLSLGVTTLKLIRSALVHVSELALYFNPNILSHYLQYHRFILLLLGLFNSINDLVFNRSLIQVRDLLALYSTLRWLTVAIEYQNYACAERRDYARTSRAELSSNMLSPFEHFDIEQHSKFNSIRCTLTVTDRIRPQLEALSVNLTAKQIKSKSDLKVPSRCSLRQPFGSGNEDASSGFDAVQHSQVSSRSTRSDAIELRLGDYRLESFPKVRVRVNSELRASSLQLRLTTASWLISRPLIRYNPADSSLSNLLEKKAVVSRQSASSRWWRRRWRARCRKRLAATRVELRYSGLEVFGSDGGEVMCRYPEETRDRGLRGEPAPLLRETREEDGRGWIRR